MLTNGKQIAAARQLLDWSQEDLAIKSGVSKPTIIRMEKDLYSVKDELRNKVVDSVNDNGVEFIEGGIREAKRTMRKYTGSDGFQQFYDDLYQVAVSTGGDICLFNGVSNQVTKWLGVNNLPIHVERMLKIKDKYNFRVVVKEGDDVFFGATYCTYRWFPETLFNDKTIYIYGTKVAFVTFMDHDVEVLVIDQQDLADCQRLFFNLAWNYIAMEIKNA